MSEQNNIKILKPENITFTLGPDEYFTGTVKVTPLIKGEDPSCMTCASVTFDPEARSAWHTHPKGQLLIVTEGLGLIQEWDKPIQIMRKGDVIWTPPQVKHWHGASSRFGMTHIATQETLDGKNVNWFEKVADEDYRKQPE
jgi:quercetin dioxygenase-like cupin family protein